VRPVVGPTFCAHLQQPLARLRPVKSDQFS